MNLILEILLWQRKARSSRSLQNRWTEPVGQGLVQDLEKQVLNKAQSEEKLRSYITKKRRFPKPKTTSNTSKRASRPATTKASPT
jgi:hypothetical protein